MASSKKEFTLRDVIKDLLERPDAQKDHELEVRFRTMSKQKLTKIDFDNVIRKLKSMKFISTNPSGEYQMKIQGEYTDVKSGRTKMSNLRTQINGISAIQTYCKENSLTSIDYSTHYMMKTYAKIGDGTVFPINNDDLQFRISYQKESILTNKMPAVRQLLSEWTNTKKNFRFINRVSFIHDRYPIRVDLSVVKSSVNQRQYNIQESGVFGATETYEIEIEVLNDKIAYVQTIDSLEKSIKSMIKLVLSGLQNTNYPVGVAQQTEVKKSYMKLVQGREKDFLHPRDFCGPASFTLELKNIQPLTDETGAPNIRENYTVTDKADGVRKLMYVDDKGKVYFIPTTMDIEFTGIVTKTKEVFNTILDGEHILHDKTGGFFDTYAAFDIYYIGGKSVRELSFVPIKETDEPNKFRLPLLNTMIGELKKSLEMISGKPMSMKIEAKKFYLGTKDISIFAGCNTILQKEKDGLFPYETDGLIFTPAEFGVGGNRKGEASRPVKTTWIHSFKWKPSKYNTIDFLVSVHKDGSGVEKIGNIFKNGTDTASEDQILQYKVLTLRVGFDPAKHGYLNPCQDVLMDKFPAPEGADDNEGYKPVAFYPTNPYDNKAHLCHQVLKRDATGNFAMMCKNGDIIEDSAIAEFRYDTEEQDEVYRWKPLRVRYDKTAELKAGQKNYGNAYHVANGNWHSIHNPVTAEMLSTGREIPEDAIDDVYYDRKVTKTATRNLRHFHNIGVKKRLIESVSHRGNNLIDFSVGKAGDLSKWTNAHLGFVFGIDISRDNIENKHDGACARYLKARRDSKGVPYGLFVNGNSALNIRSGLAMFTEKGKEITQSVFGDIPKNETLGPAVARQYGKGTNGFDVGSCQFAMHYFFENADTLQGFMRNVAECVKEGGYFIGTCYDGRKIFDALKDKKRGEGISVQDGDTKVWEIVKEYDDDAFKADETSVGYAINVYQETINKYFREYLVNFDYVIRVMENYGFKPITNAEARDLGMPAGVGNFKQLYDDKKYHMTPSERTISFFNNYFIFKKIRKVDAEKVKLEATDESVVEIKLNLADTEAARKPTKKRKKKLVIQ
jgi:SAM-dependent methyltransferase